MGNVVINGRTSVHAGSGGTVQTKDVCKTPRKCKPRTYTNIAVSADSAKTASTVIVNGNPACHIQSIFSKSTGDEAGSCGGVASGTIKQKAQFVSASSNVYLEGKPATRQNDKMISNNANTPPSSLMQPGAAQPPSLSPKGAAEIELRKTDYLLDITIGASAMPENAVGRLTSLDPESEQTVHTILNSDEEVLHLRQVPRWRLRIDNVEEREHHVYLSYKDESDPCETILSKLDTKNIPADEDLYHIPLGKVTPSERSRLKESEIYQDIQLMPVYPLRLLRHNSRTCGPMRNGYLYIFLNDSLWREIEIDADFSTFRDVNLTKYQGQDTRPAMTQRQGRFVLMPFDISRQMSGYKNVEDFKFAFSEKQWSWSYIERLGGMHKEDPRYIADLEIYQQRKKENRAGTLDAKFRDQRLQKTTLKDYDLGGRNTGYRTHFKYTLSDALKENKRYVEKYNVNGSLIEDLLDSDKNSNLPALVCYDAVGEARDRALGYKLILSTMQMLLRVISGQQHGDVKPGEQPTQTQQEEMKKQALHYRMAVVLTQYLYHGTEAKAPDYFSQEEKDQFRRAMGDRKGLRQELDRAKFDKFTEERARAHLRWEAKRTKMELVYFLRDESSQFNFTLAMEDQFAMEGKDYYFVATKTVGEIIANLLDSVEVLDAPLYMLSFNELDYLKKDKGVQYLIDLFGAGKITLDLHKKLFAKQKGDGLSLYDYIEEDVEPGHGEFSVSRFDAAIKAIEGESEGEPAWMQTGRRVSEFLAGFSEIHANVGHVLYKAMDMVEKVQKMVDDETGKIKTDMAKKKKLAAKYSDLIAATKKWKQLLNHGLRVFRMTSVLNIEELNIPPQYATRGPFPKGYTPMDVAYRQANAEKRLTELLDQNKTNLGTTVSVADQFGNDLGHHPVARALSLHAEIVDDVNRVMLRHEDPGALLPGERVGAIFIRESGGPRLLAPLSDGEVDKLLEDGVKDIEARKANVSEELKNHTDEIAHNEYLRDKVKVPVRVRLESLGRHTYNVGVMPAMLMANGYNLYYSFERLSKKRTIENQVYFISAMTDFTAVSVDAAQIIGRYVLGAPTAEQMRAAARLGMHVYIKASVPIVARLATIAMHANLVASVITAGVSLYDMSKAMSIDNTGAAIGNAAIAAGASLLAYSSIMAMTTAYTGVTALLVGLGSTGVGVIAVAIILIGAAIIWWLSDTPMQTWLKNCPWGDAAYGARFDKWKTRPDYAYYELMGLLNKPVVQFNERDEDSHEIILTVNTQGFNLKQADLDLKLEYDNGHGSKGVLTLTAGVNKPGVAKAGVTISGKGINPALFWYHAKLVVLREPLSKGVVNGLKIYMTRPMFAEAKRTKRTSRSSAGNRTVINLKASCRVWPLGKNQTISSHSGQLYSLPAPEFDDDGDPELKKVKDENTGQLISQQPVEVAETKIRLSVGDTPLSLPIRIDTLDVSPNLA